ncbi:MAG: sulfotransferase family protein [Lysobacter sp.]|nr:MAG: sulfotransferase family protein [Lysobacter sp.]
MTGPHGSASLDAVPQVQALLAAGRLADAQAFAAALLQHDPDGVEALRAASYVAFGAGDDHTAMERMEGAVAAAARDPALLFEYAQLLASIGHVQAAIPVLDELVDAAPSMFIAWILLGRLAYEMHDEPAAAAAFGRAHAIDPADAQARRGLAESLYASEAFAEALGHFIVLARQYPEDMTLRLRAASCHARLGDLDAALSFLDTAIQQWQGEPAPWFAKGQLLEDAGDATAARVAYAMAMRIAPQWVEPVAAALALDHAAPAEPLRLSAAQMACDVAIPADGRASLHYALGKAADAGGRHADAWEHWSAANAARRSQGVAESPAAVGARMRSLRSFYAPSKVRRLARPTGAGVRPVLIVGMPRSGTTLAEQVLASHPRIHGAGELPTFAQLHMRLAAEPAAMADTFRLDAAANDYLSALSRHAPADAVCLVDKQPYNFMFLGLAAILFPETRVVWCRRDPRDVAVSIYGENFGPQATYATDLQDIRVLVEAHDRLMAHWRSVLDLPVYELRYEALVGNFEHETRRLVEFTGMEWDAACLEFHQTRRVVQTNSRWQVRRPVSGRSVGRWRHYAPWLREAGFDIDQCPVTDDPQ